MSNKFPQLDLRAGGEEISQIDEVKIVCNSELDLWTFRRPRVGRRRSKNDGVGALLRGAVAVGCDGTLECAVEMKLVDGLTAPVPPPVLAG